MTKISSDFSDSIYITIVQYNETGNKNISYFSITPPEGNGGWTIGNVQWDLKTNPQDAGKILRDSLTASGNFTTEQAEAIRNALTDAGSNSNVNFGNITDSNGRPVSVESINSALSTSTAEQTNAIESRDMFVQNTENAFQAVVDNPNIFVSQAMEDPDTAVLLKSFFADYNNQYHITPGNSPMIDLLTKGEGTFGGDGTPVTTITINSATDVIDAVKRAIFATKYAVENPKDAGRRAAHVVSAWLHKTRCLVPGFDGAGYV